MSSGLRIANLTTACVFGLLLTAGGVLAQAPAAPDGTKSRDIQLKRRESSNPTDIKIPRGYAVVIGVSEYQKIDPAQNLAFPVSDAQSFYRALISQNGGGLPAENVHLLTGQNATLGNIRHEIEVWLPSVAKDSDTVVVYFAGHGLSAGKRGYLAPWDVDPNSFDTTAYPMDTLASVLADKVHANWKMIVVDACHSGKVMPGSTAESLNRQVGKASKGLLTFTATREREESFEDPKLGAGAGLFTYFLVQGLQGNADKPPCDGFITADELIDYVEKNVSQYASGRNRSQHPTALGDFDGSVALGRSTVCPSPVTSTAQDSGSLVVEVNMDGVDVYLDGKLVKKINKNTPLSIPGLAGGSHVIVGVHEGYDPDTKEVVVLPGVKKGVSLRIRYASEHPKKAQALLDRGEALLYHRSSSLNVAAIYSKSRQTNDELKKAREFFEAALKEDPRFAKAAYDLGQTCTLLSDSKAALAAYKEALHIDPSYVEARVQYAGQLIETGEAAQAVSELNEAARLEPRNDEVLAQLARAYLDDDAWQEAAKAAQSALAIRDSNEEAVLWRGVAYRQLAAAEKNPPARAQLSGHARDDFQRFLKMTNFSSPIYSQAAFYFIGFGLGSRGHADRQSSYDNQRAIALLGLCDYEHRARNFARAAAFCKQSLALNATDETAYFFLGNVYRDQYNQSSQIHDLEQARDNYSRVVKINPNFEFAKNARNYIEMIDVVLAKLR